jgi:hypothetical protein
MDISIKTMEIVENYVKHVYKTNILTYSVTTGKHREILDYLRKLKVKDSINFVQNCVLVYGHNIYLPYPIGVEFIPPIDQMRMLVHGVQHIIQEDREGRFYTHEYTTNLKKRTEWEFEATISEMCFLVLCKTHLPTKKEVYTAIKNKGCPKTEIDKCLENFSDTLRNVKSRIIQKESSNEIFSIL